VLVCVFVRVFVRGLRECWISSAVSQKPRCFEFKWGDGHVLHPLQSSAGSTVSVPRVGGRRADGGGGRRHCPMAELLVKHFVSVRCFFAVIVVLLSARLAFRKILGLLMSRIGLHADNVHNRCTC